MTRASTTSTRRPPDARPAARPDPARLAGLLVLAWSEVLDGRRPFAQLAPLLSPAIERRLAAQLAAERGRAPRGVRIRRVVTGAQVPGTCEASVVLEWSGRVSAVAVRLERHRGAWRVVELTAPEAGMHPLSTASRPHGSPDAFDEALEEAAAAIMPHGSA